MTDAQNKVVFESSACFSMRPWNNAG